LFFETAVDFETLVKRCKMPLWVHKEWTRLNVVSDETIRRYFQQESDDAEEESIHALSSEPVLQTRNVVFESKPEAQGGAKR